jgi:hypothetical protein
MSRQDKRSLKGSRSWCAVAFIALVAVGCSGSSASDSTSPTVLARPSSPAKVTIAAPTNGEVIHGNSVHVAIELADAKVVRATTTNIVPDEGHLHLSLDDRLVSMNFRLDSEISKVKPGLHILQVEFVASDHLPFDPRVIAQVTFEVKP